MIAGARTDIQSRSCGATCRRGAGGVDKFVAIDATRRITETAPGETYSGVTGRGGQCTASRRNDITDGEIYERLLRHDRYHACAELSVLI